MKNIEIFYTQDGSIGLYNKELDEIYHSKFGARQEAYDKFINPCLKLNKKPLKILDICYGIGYNTKCAIEKFSNIELIDCIEIDRELVEKSFEFEFSKEINLIIKKNLEKPDFINFYIEDARVAVQKLNKKYDIIFHDGFAPYKQSILWSEDFILKLANLMHKDSIYVTYNHSKPVLNALRKAGLILGKTIKDDKIIATIASYNEDLIEYKLDENELKELDTKSAITYKDKFLNLSHEKIIQNRNMEVEKSSLISLSKLRKVIQKG